MNRLIIAIAFLEGCISLAIQMIVLRQSVSFVGSNTISTSIVIGIFLAAMAFGYYRGGNVAGNYMQVLRLNFIKVIILTSFGLSYTVIEKFFMLPINLYFILLIYIVIFIAPSVYFLTQTLPILSNYFSYKGVGYASGLVLFYSTMGSVAGSLAFPIVLFNGIGVNLSLVVLELLVLLIYLLTLKIEFIKNTIHAFIFAFSIICVSFFGYAASKKMKSDNAYANITVTTKKNHLKAFSVNGNYSSLLESDNKTSANYIESIKLFIKQNIKNGEILIIGAGGFTLSHNVKDTNNYTYVDIDPALKSVAEKYFLEKPIHGSFVVDDAKHFLFSTKKKYDLIVLDAFNRNIAPPFHLLTQEFYLQTKKHIKENGYTVINMVAKASLDDPYSSTTYNTISSVFKQCIFHLPDNDLIFDRLRNINVFCKKNKKTNSVYTDNTNGANLDLLRR